jgi:hypothetical protein
MDTRRGARAAFAAAALLAAGWAEASVVAEPVARLAVEGGYDSNVRYDGRGGDRVAGVSPDLGFLLKDHTWNALASYGVDLLTYPTMAPGPILNQRGRLDLGWRIDPRTRFKLDFVGTYAPDPVALARLGIIEPGKGSALVIRGDSRLAWLATPRWTIAGTYAERDVAYDPKSGTLLHVPGAEAAYQLDPRTEVGAAYRFDYFQSITTGIPSSTAHEAKGIARWRWSRRISLEAEAGPAFWSGGDGSAVVPEAAGRFLASGREGELRLEVRHGLGISARSRPSLSDALEVGVVWRMSRSFRFRTENGIWRGATLPSGTNSNVGYGVAGELTWLATRDIEMGVGASRFAQLTEPSAATERNVVGVRIAWQLRNR